MRSRWFILVACWSWCVVGGAKGQLPPTPMAQPVVKGAQLYVEQRIKDLGTIYEGDKVAISWTLENRGGADLIIDQVQSSCGCTVVKLSDEEKVIRPGQSLELKADFDSTSRRESQVKTVTVMSNDAQEPELKLEIRVNVEILFDIDPPSMLSLRAVRRGVPSTRALEFFPGPGRSSINIKSMEIVEGDDMSLTAEPISGARGAGQRVRVTVPETASLGGVHSTAKFVLDVDGIVRERRMSIRGEIFADLTWLPKVVDATRQTSLPGKKFAPVTISAAEKAAFEITEVSAGPLLNASVEPGKNPASKSEYNVVLSLREDAPPGPFAATLKIRTTSLDQPEVEVPVFGIVAPPVDIEPRAVLLRTDGSEAGSVRRVKVQAASPSQKMEIKDVTCDDPAVSVRVDEQASSRYTHLKFLDVRLREGVGAVSRKSVIRLTTGMAGAEKIEIPLAIEVVPAGEKR